MNNKKYPVKDVEKEKTIIPSTSLEKKLRMVPLIVGWLERIKAEVKSHNTNKEVKKGLRE